MRIERVGLTQDTVEGKVDADRLAGGAYAFIAGRRPLPSAELRLEIRLPIHTFARQIGVQLKRMPAHHRLEQRFAFSQERERGSKAPPPNEAPWADDVGNDIDFHG